MTAVTEDINDNYRVACHAGPPAVLPSVSAVMVSAVVTDTVTIVGVTMAIKCYGDNKK